MEIHNGLLYWPITYTRKPHTNGEIAPMYDAVIVGGGMSGILTAKALIDEGLKVALVDKRLPGEGSTAANTGLLQYSNDIMLYELIEQIGEKDAVRFYELCLEALDHLEQIASTLGDNADFIRRPSIYYASSKKEVKKLQKEYQILSQHGFPCVYWDRQEVIDQVGFDKHAALVTYKDAEINPYKFAVQLVEQLQARGLDVFENTMVNIIERHGDTFELHTIEGIFHTKKIIYTVGYEKLPFGKMKGANVNRSFVAITNVIENWQPWFEQALIWETARPYLYMRTTAENRIIIGGRDEGKKKAPKTLDKIEKEAEHLIDGFKELFPHIEVEIEFLYGASFGESLDNLPFVGEHPDEPGHYYLLGFGGNGTVCSMLGSLILKDLIANRPNVDAHIVSVNRKFGLKK